MNKTKHILYSTLLYLLLTAAQGYAQQNIQFTQYIFNSISVNPAYAGYKEEWFAQVGLRSQWTDWPGAPRTGSLSVDGVLDPRSKRHAAGLQFTADKLGAQSATSIYANYALRLQLDDRDAQRLALGIAVGGTQYGLDGSKLQPVNPEDEAIPPGYMSTWNPDIRLGIYYSSPRLYVGLAVQDLFANDNRNNAMRFNQNSLESLYRTSNAYLIAGGLINIEEGLHLRPSLLVKDDFKGPTSLDLNAMLIFQGRFWIGAGYRTRARLFDRPYYDQSPMKLSAINALSGIAQFYASNNLRIGYSYDFMINQMRGLQSGTHEITLGLTMGRILQQMLSPRYF
ncbi:PorP/SprF family type IX secretion system membrane protein [Sphingobacterium griseoflavum]|uniref:Membrane protein n=1 Tax=Sphingobacterium griseoflavum TaxID=1474952 RepID=A0ABQ3HYT0_9SPHI|nr:type IX secretion system membrane protein PorP/SprF [Sphingobacterium griseoflavum]GHE39244.1 membrane protein [Sphingobacterium griseoflavum]